MNKNDIEIFVGSKQIQVFDHEKNISFPVLIQYPTQQQSSPTSFGPYLMDVSVDAEIMKGQFPLIIISHGNGGSHLIYRTISLFLAKKGYIVAMLEHFGNNRNNNSLENTTKNLQLRPKHVSITIDNLLTDEVFGKSIRAEKIAVIGHSMGGYTALALAGGVARSREGTLIEVKPDSRIKAIILMAPGAGWFMNGMQKVAIPVLMYMAEHDTVTPTWNADIILNDIPDKSLITYKMIGNAGHFSFISPFPPAMNNQNFAPSTDPAGFDRMAFHEVLPMEIFEFLEANL
jgi:predicted dienelactone hydrolase